jgi:Protein of unknown function (DUF3108)
MFCRHCELSFCIIFCLSSLQPANGQSQNQTFPFPEKLNYTVEWRLMDAGTVSLDLTRDGNSNKWNFKINIQSAGLVSRLYRVNDSYSVDTLDRFCLHNATLDAEEGKKHSTSKLVVDSSRYKLAVEERNITRNQNETRELDIAPCSYEILGALGTLRTMNLEPGKSTIMPITNGKKFAHARIMAQAKETIAVDGKKYSTTRYEAFLFDDVVYKRRGRLLIWIEDGPERLPVEFRLLLGFPIGTITVDLQKQGK